MVWLPLAAAHRQSSARDRALQQQQLLLSLALSLSLARSTVLLALTGLTRVLLVLPSLALVLVQLVVLAGLVTVMVQLVVLVLLVLGAPVLQTLKLWGWLRCPPLLLLTIPQRAKRQRHRLQARRVR